MLRRIIGILFLSLSLAGVLSCKETPSSDDPQPSDNTTFRTSLLVYMMAENDLASYAAKDLSELMEVAKNVPDDCALFAFVDGMSTPYICRFYSNEGRAVCDTIYNFSEDFNSCDTAALRNVIDIIDEKYTTENFDLIMWSHGNGWLRSNAPKRTIGVDNNNNKWSSPLSSSMEMEELAALLEGVDKRPRTLMFDACFMIGAESAYALRNSAEWIVGSPAEIPGDGAPYHHIVPQFFAKNFDVNAVIDSYKNFYPDNEGVVLSVVRADKMEQLAEATAHLVPASFSKTAVVPYSKIFAYLKGGYTTSKYNFPDYFDMNGAMKLTLSEGDYAAWREAFDAAVCYAVASDYWVTAYTASNIAKVDKEQWGGMSMFIPKDDSRHRSLVEDFKTTEWYYSAGWNETDW